MLLIIFLVFYCTIIRLHDVAFVWTRGIRYLVLPIISNSLSILYLVVLSGCILHWYQSPSRRAFCLVVQSRRLLVIEVILELLKQFMCCFLWSLQLFHFFPNVFNWKVKEFFLRLGFLFKCKWLDWGRLESNRFVVLEEVNVLCAFRLIVFQLLWLLFGFLFNVFNVLGLSLFKGFVVQTLLQIQSRNENISLLRGHSL